MIQLQVNLIRPQELRSASLVSLKSWGFIVSIILPVAIVLWMSVVYMQYLEARSGLRLREEEKAQLASHVRQARVLRREVLAQRAILDEVSGWRRSRVAWHEVLGGMWPHVPATMQWRSLLMRQQVTLQKDGKPQRESLLVLEGYCEGVNTEEQVERLRRDWALGEPMSNWVKRADVKSFREDDAPGARADGRRFQLDVTMNPGRFDAPKR